MALTQISTAGVKDDAVTSGKIPANAVGSSELADNAVDTAAIATDAVTTAKIAAGNVTATELGTGAVTSAKLAAGAVSEAGKIADSIITGAKIGSGTIVAGNLATNAVTTAKITDGNVTAAKLASGVQTTINTNADNRVITGSGTANTLNGESSLTYDGSDLNIANDVPQLLLTDNNSNSSIGRVRGNAGNLILSADTNNATAGSIINFEIDGSEQARITASTNIGIGNITPTAWGSGIPTVEFKGIGNTSRGGAIAFESQSGSNGYNVIYSDAGDLRIYTGATNRASATEKVMFPRTGGITFNGDTATANALDDYEEGTFTPVLDNSLSSVSYNAQVGHYTKIGNQVFAYVYLLATAGSSNSNSLRVSGLPFTCNSVAYHEGGGYITYINGTFGTSGVEMQAKPWVPQNQTYVLFHTPEDGNNLNGNETNFANKYLIFHVRYHV